GPGMEPDRMRDAFDEKVASFLYGSFLTGAQTVAALPGAVAYALSQAADSNGKVSSQAIANIFGPRGAAFVDELAQRIGDKPVPTQRRMLKYEHLPDGTAELVAKSADHPDLSQRMPALAEVSK